ncbi:MAG: LysR family transcriptional regulator [Alphaproteobacteria bacterium]|nr:LysR family transcriptional regulator [Alphaproteobacteria bacterium]
METYVRVVESGSFSAAARLLRVGQPAVSKTVAALEARLGVRLLARSTRRLMPTDAGQAYYERALRALAEADEAEFAARGLGRGLEGRLRVCAPVTFARLHLAPKLGGFLSVYPKLSLDLVMDDRNIDLLSENIDVALRMGALADSTLAARKISSSARYVVASKAYLAAHGAPKTPADLLKHDAVIYAQAAGGDEWRFRKGSAETSVRMQSRIAFTAAEGVREAVKAGLGLAIVSRWMMAPELATGEVAPVLQDWRLPDIDLWAVFPTGRMPSARAKAFVDWFALALRESEGP